MRTAILVDVDPPTPFQRIRRPRPDTSAEPYTPDILQDLLVRILVQNFHRHVVLFERMDSALPSSIQFPRQIEFRRQNSNPILKTSQSLSGTLDEFILTLPGGTGISLCGCFLDRCVHDVAAEIALLRNDLRIIVQVPLTLLREHADLGEALRQLTAVPGVTFANG